MKYRKPGPFTCKRFMCSESWRLGSVVATICLALLRAPVVDGFIHRERKQETGGTKITGVTICSSGYITSPARFDLFPERARIQSWRPYYPGTFH